VPGSRWLLSTEESACCAGGQACPAQQQAPLRKRARPAPQPATQPAEDVIDLTGDGAPPAHALAHAPGPAATAPPQRMHAAGPSPEVVRLQALELEVHALRRELEVRAQGMVGRTSCS